MSTKRLGLFKVFTAVMALAAVVGCGRSLNSATGTLNVCNGQNSMLTNQYGYGGYGYGGYGYGGMGAYGYNPYGYQTGYQTGYPYTGQTGVSTQATITYSGKIYLVGSQSTAMARQSILQIQQASQMGGMGSAGGVGTGTNANVNTNPCAIRVQFTGDLDTESGSVLNSGSTSSNMDVIQLQTIMAY